MTATGLLSTTMPSVFSTPTTFPSTVKVKNHAFHGED
jgi:hypothetical protein